MKILVNDFYHVYGKLVIYTVMMSDISSKANLLNLFSFQNPLYVLVAALYIVEADGDELWVLH